MSKLLRVVNKEGLFLRDDFVYDKKNEIALDVAPAQSFVYPKWNFESKQWTENGVNPFAEVEA